MNKDLLPLGVRVLLAPFGFLAALVLMIIIGLRVGLAQVIQYRADLALAKKNETILKVKQDLLTQIQPGISRQSSLAAVALPGENPLLLVVSQVKTIAAANGMVLTGLKVGLGQETPAQAGGVELSLNLSGSLPSIVNLVSQVKKIAPLTRVSSLDLSLVGPLTQATVGVRSYWAPFPTKMPAMTEPISDLNESEQKLLGELAVLTLPGFVSLTPTAPVENLNQFGE